MMMHPVLTKFFPTQVAKECDFLNLQLETRDIHKGDVLFEAGAAADCLYFILEGRFAVRKGIGIGERTQVVALLDAGTVIGEAAVATGRLRGATVVAVADATVAGLSRHALLELEQNMPLIFIGLMKKVLSITSFRLQKSSDRLALVL